MVTVGTSIQKKKHSLLQGNRVRVGHIISVLFSIMNLAYLKRFDTFNSNTLARYLPSDFKIINV